MAMIKLKYMIEDIDRHGNVRRYVRMPGHPKSAFAISWARQSLLRLIIAPLPMAMKNRVSPVK